MTVIAVQRLYSQQIETTRLAQPHEVVAWLGAMQGQDYSGAKWSVGLRLPNATDEDIEQAVARKEIVRTWALRGTLHLVAATDVRWLVGLLGPRMIASNARRYRELELDEATLVRGNDVLARALSDGQQRDRPSLFEVLEANGISTAGQRGVYLLQRASLDGLIGQGAAPRNVPTFYALDTLPAARALTREESLTELARRYFTSHGPATLRDFVWWTGLPAAEARAGLEGAKDDLIQETLDDQSYWWGEDAQTAPVTTNSIHLLPGFDEFLLGYRERDATLAAEYANKIVPGGNGVFYPTIVSGGRVVGTWKRTLKKRQVVVTAQPFEGLSTEAWRGFAESAVRFGAFLGLPVELPDETLK